MIFKKLLLGSFSNNYYCIPGVVASYFLCHWSLQSTLAIIKEFLPNFFISYNWIPQLEMENLREKPLFKKAIQAILDEQKRKDREYEEKMATTEYRRHKELAEFSRMKAVSKHQIVFNYINRERLAEYNAVKGISLPTGLGEDHIWLNIPQDLQEHSEVLAKGLSKSKITHRTKRDAATHHYSINISSI